MELDKISLIFYIFGIFFSLLFRKTRFSMGLNTPDSSTRIFRQLSVKLQLRSFVVCRIFRWSNNGRHHRLLNLQNTFQEGALS